MKKRHGMQMGPSGFGLTHGMAGRGKHGYGVTHGMRRGGGGGLVPLPGVPSPEQAANVGVGAANELRRAATEKYRQSVENVRNISEHAKEKVGGAINLAKKVMGTKAAGKKSSRGRSGQVGGYSSKALQAASSKGRLYKGPMQQKSVPKTPTAAGSPGVPGVRPQGGVKIPQATFSKVTSRLTAAAKGQKQPINVGTVKPHKVTSAGSATSSGKKITPPRIISVGNSSKSGGVGGGSGGGAQQRAMFAKMKG